MIRNRPLKLAKSSNAADAFFVQSFNPWVDIVAVAVLSATAFEMGILNALTTISFMLFGIPIGVLVDRLKGHQVLRFALLAKLILASAVLFCTVTNSLNIGLLMLFVALIGLVTTTTETAQTSTIPSVADDADSVRRAIVNIASWDRVATLMGPVAVGIGIASLGAPPVLSASLAMALAALLLSIGVRPNPSGVRQPTRDVARGNVDQKPLASGLVRLKDMLRAFTGDVREGWSVLTKDKQLVGMTWQGACVNAGLATGAAVEAILILQELDLGVVFFGVLGSVGAIGGVCASFISGAVSSRLSPRRLYVTGGLIQSLAATLPLVALLLPAAAPAVLLVHVLIWSVTVTITNVSAAVYASVTVDQQVLGRIASVRRTITMGSVPVASVVGGSLGSIFGLWLPLVLWPVLVLTGVAVFAVMDRQKQNAAS